MKRGQAAMEFLMTYGWAILVVLAAIGALAYFGVLSPDKFMPSKCLVSGGFSCVEYKLDGTNDEVRIYLQNNLGVDADYANVTLKDVSGVNCTSSNISVSGDIDGFPNGERKQITFDGGCTLTGGTFKGTIGVTYRKSGDTESHTTSGSISGKFE